MSTDDERAANGGGTDDSIDPIPEEPIDGDGVYAFAGITRHDENVEAVGLPTQVGDQTSSMTHWARHKIGHTIGDADDMVDRNLDSSVLPDRGLMTLTQELPRASHAQPAWIHPRTGEVIETGKHNAVIATERVENVTTQYGTKADAVADMCKRDRDEAAEAIAEMGWQSYADEHLTDEQAAMVEDVTVGDDALYHIAGGDHTIINPQQPLEELARELQDRDLGDKVFGEVTIDRDGGRASLDLYLDGQHVESPVFADDREPVVVGLQVQWSFFDDWAFRVCGQGLDWACTNHIHRMTDREVVKYAGDVEGRVEWREMFADILDRLDEKRDQLARIIQAASEETLDFADLPDDLGDQFEDEPAPPWMALYAYLGLPEYLAREAGTRLRQQAEEPYEPDWWEIHSAATWAVSHHDRGSRTSGGSFEDHARVANDMLMNPAAMEGRMAENYEASRRDDQQAELSEEGGGVAEIRTAFENTREKKERYEEWEEEIRDMGVEL